MKITFFGTRGSIPVCDPDYTRFGGNTSCVTLEDVDGTMLIIDAGTGIRQLNYLLRTKHPSSIHLVFTHFHWDHIQGFPFFNPAYDANVQMKISTLSEDIAPLKKALVTQMDDLHFPVQFQHLNGNIELGTRPDCFSEVFLLNHPGKETFGFRYVTKTGKVLVYMVDHEHKDGILDEQYIRVCQNADLLIHDGQYTSTEYKYKLGWGHSSHEQAVALATAAGVKQLIITHHDPNHNDKFLLAAEENCQKTFSHTLFSRNRMIFNF